ncbi:MULTISPECIES: cbb3-type cytochrome oxidase assembly protein CcoS [Phenylobacterium]|uniref:Cbb3-type cytochrome oxidase maturation protein n=1 Tax=Phenylobacterium koreense TaxID=266125 RepID=A0ABV2EE92_9CAUL
MSILIFLAPASVFLALIGLAAFWWTFRAGQYDDPMGDASRILIEDPADRPLSD